MPESLILMVLPGSQSPLGLVVSSLVGFVSSPVAANAVVASIMMARTSARTFFISVFLH